MTVGLVGVLASLTLAFPSVRVADVLAIFGIVSVAAGSRSFNLARIATFPR